MKWLNLQFSDYGSNINCFTFSLSFIAAYVSRTYIGGAAASSQSSLAMKINRKSSKSQLSLFPNTHGSLSSLHETALTSDAEEVRSSVSAYQPVSSYSKRSSKRYLFIQSIWDFKLSNLFFFKCNVIKVLKCFSNA